tara:strand:+ start:306 stop:713 length:408 start_codon:yes stop_codon:yes gene_type:complete
VIKKIVLNKKVSEVIFGGAIGVDSAALLWALYYKKTHSHKTFPQLTVILPCTLDEQPSDTHEITQSADTVIELRCPITSKNGFQAYRDRNTEMITRADRLVAFHNGNSKSGTRMAINIAGVQKKPHEIIDIEGKN